MPLLLTRKELEPLMDLTKAIEPTEAAFRQCRVYPGGKMRRVGTGESVFVTRRGAERFTNGKLEFPVVA